MIQSFRLETCREKIKLIKKYDIQCEYSIQRTMPSQSICPYQLTWIWLNINSKKHQWIRPIWILYQNTKSCWWQGRAATNIIKIICCLSMLKNRKHNEFLFWFSFRPSPFMNNGNHFMRQVLIITSIQYNLPISNGSLSFPIRF